MVQLSIYPNPKVTYDVLYEDQNIAAVYKPCGVVTQPGIGHQRDSLLNGLFDRWGRQLQNLGKKRDFGLLHRLDRGTSGVILIGLSVVGYDRLRVLFKQRMLKKIYWAMIHGVISPLRGSCTLPITERRVNGKKRALTPTSSYQKIKARRDKKETGQVAITHYHTLSVNHPTASLIKCDIETGRLHQIRAHMSALGHPVIGDFEYGGKTDLNLMYRGFARGTLALHAHSISFQHPITHLFMNLQAPPPSSWMECCTLLDLQLP